MRRRPPCLLEVCQIGVVFRDACLVRRTPGRQSVEGSMSPEPLRTVVERARQTRLSTKVFPVESPFSWHGVLHDPEITES